MNRFTLAFIIATAVCNNVVVGGPVEDFGNNYPSFRSGRFSLVVKNFYDPKLSPAVTVWQVTLDPPNWRFSTVETASSLQDGKVVTNSLRAEQLIGSDGVITVSADKSGKALRGIAARVKPLSPREK